MGDILEISSDSNDTIILENDEIVSKSPEADIQSIVNKYIADNSLETEAEYDQNSLTAEDAGTPFIKRIKTSSETSSQDEIERMHMLVEKYKLGEENDCMPNKSISDFVKLHSTKEAKKREKEIQKRERELLKQQKIEEKASRKREQEQEKNIKQALNAANKNLKPTECMKFITVIIDTDIVNESYGNDVTSALQTADVQYKSESQLFSQCISWIRKVQSNLIDDNGKLVLSSKEDDTEHVLLIMNCKDFLEHVHNDSLCAHIQTLKSVLVDKKITLVIYGLQSYNRFQKSQKFSEMRSQIANNDQPTKTKSFFQNFPKVSKQTIENALTELQLLCSCSTRMVDSGPELGAVVVQFTKAVAEIPYKLQKYEKLQKTEWFVSGDNRDCVKIDKNGNGLNRLWNQMLTTFPLARLETAEAISSKYPSVSSLMKAYDGCQSIKEAESLLQDIPIRRAAGPLTSTRKIGPELSKKACNFFTSTDGESLL